MKKKLKELIASAPHRIAGRYDAFLVIDEKTEYDHNGYNIMTVLGYDETTETWYNVSEHGADVLCTFCKMSWNIDIPAEYGCTRIWFDKPVYINFDFPCSSVRVADQHEDI